MTFPEGKLRTGLPVAEAKAFAKEVVEHPEWVGALIEVASHREGGTVPRKAAWVLPCGMDGQFLHVRPCHWHP